MNIPRGSYAFEDENALLITTGKQTGRLFYAHDGRITEIDSAFVPTPKYSDREGFFTRSGRGGSYGSGAPYEPKDKDTKKKFLKLFTEKIKTAAKDRRIDTVYVFSPNYEITELKSSLPPSIRENIRFSFMGNLVKFAPDALLEKINGRLAKLRTKIAQTRPEESKILERPRGTEKEARRQAAKLASS